jgi:hypothetical protein
MTAALEMSGFLAKAEHERLVAVSVNRASNTSHEEQAAIAELQALIKQHYPDATFRVECGTDDPEAIHLIAVVDVDDQSDVLDAVVDRMMEIQIEEELPIFVIPVRPPARAAEWLAAQRGGRTGDGRS